MTPYITTRFERVPLTAIKNVSCEVCGRKVRRQQTFEQTINPFNKNAADEIKSYKDIYPELEAEAEAWKSEPEVHTKCAGDGASDGR